MIKSPLVNIICSSDSGCDYLRDKGKVYSFLNPVSYLDALDNVSVFERMDGVFADGSLLVLAICLLYGRKVKRRSFDMTSLAAEILTYANVNSKKVCVVASHEESLSKAISILSVNYPNIEWVGCRNGYFANEDEMNETAQSISLQNPDFLIVGMGAILQEEFLLRCKSCGFGGIGFSCGGFIHQTAENGDAVDYYPHWVDAMNLRFLYRIVKEPHTRKRYAAAALRFPALFILEKLKG